jgi:electron transfer flavoprotein alpha subunit
MAEKLGIYIELKDGAFKKSNRELLSLAAASGREVVAIVFSDAQPHLAELAGIATVVQMAGVEWQPDVWAATLARIIREHGLHDVLASHSTRGKDLMARAAARLGVGLVSDCVQLDLAARRAVKPVYAGKLLAEYLNDSEWRLYTVRPNVLPVQPAAGSAPTVVTAAPEADPGRARVVETVAGDSRRIDVAEADIIVSGGRAMKSKENFAILDELAQVLHAAVGASRAAVDAGFAGSDMQVGQTGKVVNPKLYIACGISGAIQHFVGMKTAKVIVAINKDPEAPIFKKSDYGIVGDLFTVVPLLKEELKKSL